MESKSLITLSFEEILKSRLEARKNDEVDPRSLFSDLLSWFLEISTDCYHLLNFEDQIECGKIYYSLKKLSNL